MYISTIFFCITNCFINMQKKPVKLQTGTERCLKIVPELWIVHFPVHYHSLKHWTLSHDELDYSVDQL